MAHSLPAGCSTVSCPRESARDGEIVGQAREEAEEMIGRALGSMDLGACYTYDLRLRHDY